MNFVWHQCTTIFSSLCLAKRKTRSAQSHCIAVCEIALGPLRKPHRQAESGARRLSSRSAGMADFCPGVINRPKVSSPPRGLSQRDGAARFQLSHRAADVAANEASHMYDDSEHDLAVEDKCRNILVRYCAHVPRNYQYKDGIQVVFLILRDHLGDDRLGVAGGVLYELIEVDCDHSDDAGAGFQRWRHDHMHRHTDLELPHIPHLTTVTSAIKPSSYLVRWRQMHPSRYPIRLSDYAPPSSRGSAEASCIRNRKAWVIEHTMYVSSRDGGTSVFRKVSPGQCHRVQWNMEATGIGKFIQQKEIVLPSELDTNDINSLASRPDQCTEKAQERTRPVSSVSSMLRGMSRRNLPWICDYFSRCPVSEEQDVRHGSHLERAPLPRPSRRLASLPEGHIIPHPSFARKHALVKDTEPIPRSMAGNLMPTAESVATVANVVRGAQCSLARTNVFRGPFTPQLGFDGGRDFEYLPTQSEAAEICQSPAGSGSRQRILPGGGQAAWNTRMVAVHRPARDWFGLDAEELPLQFDPISGATTRRAPYCKQAVHGYNWFGLD